MNTSHAALGLVLTVLSATAAAAPFPMAAHGESYSGPKTLTVEVAPAAKGDKALVKVYGINHPWDGKVVMADVRRGTNDRIEYVIRWQGKEWVLLRDYPDRDVRFNLPGAPEVPLSFQRGASLELNTSHVGSDYERPEGAVK